MPMMGRPWRMSGVLAVAAVWSFTASPSGAIVVDLDPAAVKQAIEGGKKMTDEDLKTIPTRFGANLKEDLCGGDRKSTRLNSSHSQISYAVFCLKKKKRL